MLDLGQCVFNLHIINTRQYRGHGFILGVSQNVSIYHDMISYQPNIVCPAIQNKQTCLTLQQNVNFSKLSVSNVSIMLMYFIKVEKLAVSTFKLIFEWVALAGSAVMVIHVLTGPSYIVSSVCKILYFDLISTNFVLGNSWSL